MSDDVTVLRLLAFGMLIAALVGCDAPSARRDASPTVADASTVEESLVGLEMADEELMAAGLTPVRTMGAACALLFDGRDIPALIADTDAASLDQDEIPAMQDALSSVAYSGPDVLRDDAGTLIDQLDAGDAVDAAERDSAERLAAACETHRD